MPKLNSAVVPRNAGGVLGADRSAQMPGNKKPRLVSRAMDGRELRLAGGSVEKNLTNGLGAD